MLDAKTLDAALQLLGGLVLDNGRRWGDVATDLQWADAEAVLAGRDPRRHWLGRARGYSKTTDVAALLVVLLLVLRPGSECVAAAADSDQAAILVRRMRGFATRTPGVAELFEVTARRVTCRQSGTFVEVLAADGASAWGLLPHVVVADEFPVWKDTPNTRELWDALTTAVPKVAGARLIVMGTAGDPGSWQARIREQALADPANWNVSEPAGPPPWMSRAEIELERATRLPATFARLFENVWAVGHDRLTSPAEVEACVGHRGPLEPRPQFRYQMGLDIGLTNDRTVLTVAHVERRESGPVVVVDRQLVWQGSPSSPVDLGQVEASIVDCARRYGAGLAFDPYQAAHITQRVKRRGIPTVAFPFTSTSTGRLAVTMFRLLRDRRLDLDGDDRDLLDELARVKLVETHPGSYRIDHASGEHDDRVISLALACQHLVDWLAPGTATVSSSAGLELPKGSLTPASADAQFAGGSGRSGTGRQTLPRRSRQRDLLRRQGIRVIPPGAWKPRDPQ
jgi:phage terminase large subunit-like protein